MFGFSGAELLVILAIALVVVGPDKLPEIAKVIGKVYREFQNAADELKREMQNAAAQSEKQDSSADKSSSIPENPPLIAGRQTGDEPEAKPQADGSEKKAD